MERVIYSVIVLCGKIERRLRVRGVVECVIYSLVMFGGTVGMRLRV